jgi:hypothetical protein
VAAYAASMKHSPITLGISVLEMLGVNVALLWIKKDISLFILK